MNIASKTRLSLRKLFTALLAVGPLAVLPSPVWAVIPTSSSFTTTSGTVSLSSSGSTVNVNFSDKAILTWGTTAGATNFNVGVGETWNFASTGSVLNKVSKGTGTDAAVINGALLGSSAKVFILADGGIVIGANAQLNTQNLVLSTVPELADAIFLSLGDLAYSGGTASGGITFGSGVSIGGNLTATASSFTTTGASITAAGDVVLRSLGNTTGLVLPTTTVNGNLSVSTVNGAITQAGAVSVGAVTGTQTATLNAGTADITLATLTNNFDRVVLTGGNVTVNDANIITVGASAVAGNLSMKVGGLPSQAGIATDGALVVTGNVNLDSSSSALSGITIANNSSIGGYLSAKTSGGSVSATTVGNLTVGNITNNATATPIGGGSYAAATATAAIDGAGAITIAASNFNAGAPSAPNVSSAGPAITFSSPTASVTFNATQNTSIIGAGGFGTGMTVTAANSGSGYTGLNAGSVSIIGGGGSGATATITPNGAGDGIASVTITGGTGYTTAPTVFITSAKDATAVAATGTAVVNTEGRMVGITVTSNGTGYGATAPTITIGGGNATTGGVTINASGAVVTQAVGAASSTTGITSDRNVNIRGTSIENQARVLINNSQYTTTMASTNGTILLNSTVRSGRVSLTATGGNLSQTAAGIITTNNTSASSFNAVGFDVTLNQANDLSGGTFNVSAGNATLASINNFTLGTANVTGNLTVLGSLNKNLTLGSGTGGDATRTTVGGVLTVTALGNGTITDNNDSALTATGGMVLSSVSGDIVLDAATFPGAFTPSVQSGAISASTTGNVTLTETTTLNLGNITAGNLTAASASGSIVDSGSIRVDAGTATFTVSGNNNVVLDTPVAAATLTTAPTESRIGKIALNGGLDNSITNLNGAVEVTSILGANGTTTIGTASGLTTANAPITLGNITTGNLSVNAGGYINVAGFSTISGNLSLTAAGVIADAGTLAPTNTWIAPVVAVNEVTGRLTGISSNSSSTVGMVTFATAPTVTVVGNGVGGVAPTTAATVTATLNAAGQITGFNVTNSASNGSYTNGVAGAGLPTVTITGATNTSVVQTSNGALKVGGTTTLATAGNAVLYRNNDFNNVVLASPTGGAIINDINNVSVSGTAGTAVSVTAGSSGTVATGSPANIGSQLSEAGTWGVTLGNLNVGSIFATATNGGAGNSGRIAQSTGSSIFSFGTSSFTTSNNSITVANAGNSFGRVQLTSGGGAITFAEDGSIRLGNLSSGNATVSLTSRTGSIIEDNNTGAGNTTLSTGSAGNVTLSAANGSILLGNTTQTGQSTTGGFTARVNASAPAGQVALISSGNLSLGTIDANSLTVATTGLTGEITQAAAAKVYGTTSFTAASGNIAVTNTGNNFGRVFVAGNAGISIVENGTLNLGRVTMPAAATGNFSATSVNGDIIDTGLSNVRPGGTVGGAGTGVVSLTASNGNITLDDPTTEFPTSGGVVFNAKNVTLAPLGGATLVLGAANQTASAANLTVTSATGSIGNAGAVKVTSDASFQTGTGNIDLTNSGNAFGSVRFAGAVVSITEADDIALASGSSATGAATFNSVGGSIAIVNKGGTINLNSTGLFTASGNITLAKLIQANGTITVSAPGTKDLSALSLAGDLAGKAPTNIGTGTYLPPSP
jgi:filamentous hemagglutinin family protein